MLSLTPCITSVAHGAHGTLTFDTHEATFANVDVSPDGRTVVFDLLGKIYTLPIAGGDARPLLRDDYWSRAPRFSPDGASVAFISDRRPQNGVDIDNVWTLGLSTRRLRQVTNSRTLLQSVDGAGVMPYSSTLRAASVDGTPNWLPTGSEVAFGVHNVESKIQVARLSHGRLRMLEPGISNVSEPTGRMLTSASTAVFSPDGNNAYFSETHLVIGLSNAATRTNTVLYRLDLRSMSRYLLSDDENTSNDFAPAISRDGKLLAYLRWLGPTRTELRIRHLPSGSDTHLAALDMIDDPYRWGDRGNDFPSYAFTPDDKYVVMFYGGKLHKLGVDSGSDTTIPFTVHVVRKTIMPVQAHHRMLDHMLWVRAIRWPSLSTDGRRLLFSAVGYLWTVGLPDGKPTRLTLADDIEYAPSMSRDGRYVAYVAYESSNHGLTVRRGRLMVFDVISHSTREIMADGASYIAPAWAADGLRLAVIREIGGGSDAKAFAGWVDIHSSTFHPVCAVATSTSRLSTATAAQSVGFSADGGRLVVTRIEPVSRERSVTVFDLDGSHANKRVTITGESDSVTPSPNLLGVLVVGPDETLYVARLPGATTTSVHLLSDTKSRVKIGAAQYAYWRDDRTIVYGLSNRVFRYDLRTHHSTLLYTIALHVPLHEASGITAFTDARLITLSGHQGEGAVIERGTLVINGRRIAAVGPSMMVKIPPGARIVNARGLTIMPGLIDAHYHYGSGYSGSTPFTDEEGALADHSTLAYGVTTIWEAMGYRDDSYLARAELREAGRSIGARWLFANSPLNEYLVPPQRNDGRWRRSVYDEALTKVALGAGEVLKEYDAASREEARRYSDVARTLGVKIVSHAEGLSYFLRRAADGYSVDHAFIPVPLYDDVTQFILRSGVVWTPTNTTITIGTSSPWTWSGIREMLEEVQNRDPQQRAKLRRYGTWADSHHVYDVPNIGYEQTRAARVARAVAAIVRAGGKVVASGHNSPAILMHFEMWAIVRGGATPGQALRAATMTAAEKLGLQDEIGSLETGKLADVLVLTANPLDAIDNSIALKYTVSDGIVYDSDSLQVVHPTDR